MTAASEFCRQHIQQGAHRRQLSATAGKYRMNALHGQAPSGQYPHEAAALQRQPEESRNGTMMLARLLETISDRTAEILEQTVQKMDMLSTQVFGEGSRGKRRPPRKA